MMKGWRGMTEIYVVDTNALLNSNSIIEDLNGKIIIPSIVLEELENQKSKEGKLGYNARRSIRYIRKNKSKLISEINENKYIDLLPDEWSQSNDNLIIMCAKKNKATLVTDDILMELRAESIGVKIMNYVSKKEDDIYTGIKYLILDMNKEEDESLLAYLYESPVKSDLNLYINQYLVIKDKNKPIYDSKNSIIDYEVIDKFKNTEQGICNLKRIKTIENRYNGKIKARNIEQQLLIDALNSDSTVVATTGGFGAGKTYLLMNYALQELQNGNIKKIVHISNNSQTKDTREIAALPGNLLEKEMPFVSVYIDYLGKKEALETFVSSGEIEIVPVGAARGRNFEDAIVFVNECQNLTEEHVKLLLGRVAEKTKILFDGDIKQTDSYKFQEKSGLRLLTELRHHNEYSKMFNLVNLKSNERSKTSQMSAWLDEL